MTKDEGEETKGTISASGEQAMQTSGFHNITVPTELNWVGNMAENLNFSKQKFNMYKVASKSTNESSEYQVALLLSTIGDRALKIYNNFTYTTTEDKNKIEVVLTKFEEYFVPDKNVTYERHIFFLREQKPEESIDSYVTDLRDLSSTCEFGTLTDSLIKDRIILGITDRTLKDRLLRVKNLTLNEAVDTLVDLLKGQNLS